MADSRVFFADDKGPVQTAPEGEERRNSKSWVLGTAYGETNGDGLDSEGPRIEQVIGRRGLVVREYRARNLSAEFVNRWDHLESRSHEANPFLSPWFVLPALQHLPQEAEKDPIVLGVESEDGDELLGLGIFEPCLGNRLLPLPHLRSWKCVHSFLDGFLLDRERSLQAATALFEWIRGQGKRRRELNRRIRKLKSFGAVDFSMDGSGNRHSVPLESFLELEAMGWKGEEETALVCDPSHERFARAMVAGLSKVGKVVFAQLTVGDRLAATDLYLRSGDSLFGFKSGWNPHFKKGSPGVILKLRLMETIRDREEIECVDSCAAPGSWIEPIWPSLRRLTTGVFPTTPVAQRMAGTALKLRSFKQRIRAVRGPAGAGGE